MIYAEAQPTAAAYVEPARRMTLNGWAVVVIFLPPALLLFTVFVFLPIVEAGWYGFFNWNGYGRPEKFIGLKNYGYLFSNADLRTGRSSTTASSSLLSPRPAAACARGRADGRRPGRWRRLVPDDLLPALRARGRRRRADLALHVRRRLWACRRGHHRARGAALFPARRQDLGVLRGADRRPVEIFRLPHDALYRRPAGDRQFAARGGGDGRRERVPALLAHHACRCLGR